MGELGAETVVHISKSDTQDVGIVGGSGKAIFSYRPMCACN